MSNTAWLILYFCNSIKIRPYQLTEVLHRLSDVSKFFPKWWVFYLCECSFPFYNLSTAFAPLHLGKIGSQMTDSI